MAAIHASLEGRPYPDEMADDLHEEWPRAGHALLAELAAARGRVALVVASTPLAADGLVGRLRDDLNLTVVPLGKALAELAELPTAEEISEDVSRVDARLVAWVGLGVLVEGAAGGAMGWVG